MLKPTAVEERVSGSAAVHANNLSSPNCVQIRFLVVLAGVSTRNYYTLEHATQRYMLIY